MKKMTKKGLAVLTAAVLMFAFAGQANAYRVTNNSDIEMRVAQVYNDGYPPFDKGIEGHGNWEACYWENDDCNGSGGPTDPVGLDVNRVLSLSPDQEICNHFYIPANGDLYVYDIRGFVCSQNQMTP